MTPSEIENLTAAFIALLALRTSGGGSWGEAAGGEEHAEPVVLAVAEPAREAAVELDDPVHGFGAAVG